MDKQERKLQIRTNTQQMEEIDHLMLLFPEHKFPDIARSCLLIELPMLEARPEQLQQAVDVLGNGFTESMDLRLGIVSMDGWPRWLGSTRSLLPTSSALPSIWPLLC